MPGIDARAPERTDSSSGSAGVAERLAHLLLDEATPGSTSAWISFNTPPPCSVKAVQASVLMVKPEGTVIPRRHISARLAPLPPSRFFMDAAPSVRVVPNT